MRLMNPKLSRSSTPPSEQDMMIYFTFCSNALYGLMQGADKYFRENRAAILRAAKMLMRNVSQRECYRGVLLKTGEIRRLKAELQRQFISFTEDLKIACDFANPDHELAYPELGRNGFIIFHIPTSNELLFHYSIMKRFEELFLMMFQQIFQQRGSLPCPIEPGDTLVDALYRQREVILVQRGQVFDLIRADEIC